MSDGYTRQVNVVSRLGAGVVGGVAGGVVLALILTVIGGVRDYGKFFDQDSMQNSWVILLVVSAIGGSIFGVFLGRYIRGQIIPAIGVGLVYGGAWWLLIAMVVLPLRHGKIFDLGDNGLVVMGAYVIFGVVTSIVYAIAGPRRRYYGRRYGWGRRRHGNVEVEIEIDGDSHRPRRRGRSRRREYVDD
jgi:hypothetical protein